MDGVVRPELAFPVKRARDTLIDLALYGGMVIGILWVFGLI